MAKKAFKEKNIEHVFHLQARKSLGQNFLSNKNIIEKIVNSVENLFTTNSFKYVHEIGPGSGALTLPLLEKGINILALEKDQRSVQGLRSNLGVQFQNLFSIIETDILKWSPNDDINLKKNNFCVCVGNLPYYITSDILFWFCKNKSFYKNGVFMVQNEVADRLTANPSTKDYGRLTIRTQLFFEVKKLFVVEAACFVPKPKVDSAVVMLTPKDFQFASEAEDNSFTKFTAQLFSARRKMLRKALQPQIQFLEQKNLLKEFWDLAQTFKVSEQTRPDAIGYQAIYNLHKFIFSAQKNCR